MQEMLDAEIWTIVQTKDGSAVLLRPKNMDLAVPIFVGQLEIQSILIGREGLSLPRPLTHDLFLSLIQSQNLALERVEIHELKENTFHARLVINGGVYAGSIEEKPLILDSRPSDALALATRQKCPILVSSDIVRQAGVALDIFVSTLGTSIPGTGAAAASPFAGNSPAAKVEAFSQAENRRRLLQQMNMAVAKEEYEQAAKIRDMLKEMDSESADFQSADFQSVDF
jgi:bifunctional DNase/RNase